MFKSRIYYIALLLISCGLSTIIKHKVMTMLLLILITVPVISLILFIGAVCSVKIETNKDVSKIKRGHAVQMKMTARCGFLLSFAYAHFIREGNTDVIMCLPFLSKQRVKYQVECNNIGIKRVSADYVKMYDMSGLFCIKRRIKSQTVAVYPNIIKVKNLDYLNVGVQSQQLGKTSIKKDNLLVSHIREYSQEDTMRSIHWKLSSKMNKLMVKNYESVLELFSILIVDVSDEKTRDLIIENAISIVNNNVEKGLSSRIIFANIDCLVTDNNSYNELLNKTVNTDFSKQYDFNNVIENCFESFNAKCNLVVVCHKETDLQSILNTGRKINVITVE